MAKSIFITNIKNIETHPGTRIHQRKTLDWRQ